MNGGTYLGQWPLSRSEEARELTDRRALYEARMTTDFRGAAAPRTGLFARLRGALGSQPEPVQPCVCPA